MPKENIQLADSFASDYDKAIVQNNWHGPQILFDMLQRHLQNSSKILDLGIGTGESAVFFQKAGHKIYGVDGSAKMLEQCKSKNIAEELYTIDLETEVLPFSEDSFQAVISNGVFHLINPLELIFSEVSRVLSPLGYFIFTYENTDETQDYVNQSEGVWEKKTSTGVYTFKYDDLYIKNLLQKNYFYELEHRRFLAFRSSELKKDFFFNALLAQLK